MLGIEENNFLGLNFGSGQNPLYQGWTYKAEMYATKI